MVKKAEYKKKPNWKNDTGRPTKYKSEYCQMIVDYFSQDIRDIEEVEIKDKKWNTTIINKKTPKRLPTISKFGLSIGIADDTLSEWAKEHADFSVAYRKAKDLQKNFLNDCALLWLYDSGYSKFVAINCTDMKDKSEVDNNLKWDITISGITIDICN